MEGLLLEFRSLKKPNKGSRVFNLRCSRCRGYGRRALNGWLVGQFGEESFIVMEQYDSLMFLEGVGLVALEVQIASVQVVLTL